MKYDAIFVLGLPGAGKGTQAKVLAEKLGFFYWEMGGIIREFATHDTPDGRRVKELHDSGVLFQDADLYPILLEKIKEVPENNGIVFDGMPRRLTQAEFITKYLREERKKENLATVYLNLSIEECKMRLLKRVRQGETRADDAPEKNEFKIRQQNEELAAVLPYLREHTVFYEIDDRPPIEEVTELIDRALDITSSTVVA